MGDKSCEVCGDAIHPLAKLCRRCKKFVDRADTRRKPDRGARIAALREAWDGSCFRCHYSGVCLVEDDARNPRYLTFDHRTPRTGDNVVVAASCINDMKSDLSETEFRALVIGLAHRFQGGKFDEKLLHLSHWKR